MARPEHPEVSIIVIGWRHAPLLQRCLAALADTVDRKSVEIIVTLNEPAPSLLAELNAHPEWCDERLVATTNRGYAAANNAGAEAARGRFLVLLNDDAVPQTGWLEPLIARLSADASIGAVGPAFVAPSGSLVEAGCWLSSDATPTPISTNELPYSRLEAGPVPYASASTLALRREEFFELGGFDLGYFPAYFEDTDLAMKYLDRGLATWVEPASRVQHSREGIRNNRYAFFLVTVNRHRFVERWCDVLSEFPPLGTPSDGATHAEIAIATVTALAASPRKKGPAVPDVEVLSDEAMRAREIEITQEYTTALSAILDQLEERDAKFQVLVAERDQTLSVMVPDLEKRLIAANEELDEYRSRRVIRALNAWRRARSILSRSQKS